MKEYIKVELTPELEALLKNLNEATGWATEGGLKGWGQLKKAIKKAKKKEKEKPKLPEKVQEESLIYGRSYSVLAKYCNQMREYLAARQYQKWIE